ncbi:CRIB domain-containing protein RIC7 [Forsythia ovata]|uniref:CRIB domain-containing protein RIC7 n=1 Tax=Forsythia ovata TaxID=205694 RepID=A0ABD1S592_9LAMI
MFGNASHIFLCIYWKDREIEIGYPTDVKHVAHIGWEGPSGSAPTWMNEFNSGPDFAATSIGFGQSMRQQSATDNSTDMIPAELPSTQKKQKRKKSKSTSSPKSGSSSSRSRVAKSKSKFIEGNAKLTNIEVA